MYLNKLNSDNIYPKTKILELKEITSYNCSKNLKNCLLSNNRIVNIFSDKYKHIPNEIIIPKIDTIINNLGYNYTKSTTNLLDSEFCIDYIINSEKSININGDKLTPLIRVVNSYSGKEKFFIKVLMFREICSNGLNVLNNSYLDISFKHTQNWEAEFLAKISSLHNLLSSDKIISLQEKIKNLKLELINPNDYVKEICEKTDVFKFDCSDTNPNPSKNAQFVINNITKESKNLNEKPNKWLAYNSFNEILFNKFSKTQREKNKIDEKIFNLISN